MIRGAEELLIDSFRDNRGSLYFSEFLANLPFVIRRIYYICDVMDEKTVRGCHAHKNLEQVILCFGGSCDILLDNGEEKQLIRMDSPGRALYIHGVIWREITNITKNATIMVLASDIYDESDYLRSYEDFIDYVKKEKQ